MKLAGLKLRKRSSPSCKASSNCVSSWYRPCQFTRTARMVSARQSTWEPGTTQKTPVSPPSLYLWTGTHTRVGWHTNGDHTGSQPLVWDQGEQGKPIPRMNTARCKELNMCWKQCAGQLWAYQGTRAARQLWLQSLSLPQWHWLKKHLIEFCLADLITWLQPSFWHQSSKPDGKCWPRAKKLKTGTDWVGQALKIMF